MLNIHYSTDRQQPPKSESPHSSFFLQQGRKPFWQGAGRGGTRGQPTCCRISECHCFLRPCRCENCQQISCRHCCKYSVISAQAQATSYTSSRLREVGPWGEAFSIWYSCCCFMRRFNLTIRIFKATCLSVLFLQMVGLHSLPPPLRVTGLAGVRLTAIPAVLSQELSTTMIFNLYRLKSSASQLSTCFAIKLAHGEGANSVPAWNWKVHILFTFHFETSFHQVKI